MISKLTNRAVNEGLPATVEEALQLNSLYSTAELSKSADAIRMKWCGNKIHTCRLSTPARDVAARTASGVPSQAATKPVFKNTSAYQRMKH